jgi:RNA polymerase sigma-70 factor (ECF subfamily)
VLVNGAAGAVLYEDGKPVSVMAVLVSEGKVLEIDVLADRERLSQLALSIGS